MSKERFTWAYEPLGKRAFVRDNGVDFAEVGTFENATRLADTLNRALVVEEILENAKKTLEYAKYVMGHGYVGAMKRDEAEKEAIRKIDEVLKQLS